MMSSTLPIEKKVIDQNKTIDENKALDTAIRQHYEYAGPDYEYWSQNFNLHFGYYRKGLNALNRESLLEEMNQQVLKRLQIPLDSSDTLLDLGCGLGATSRAAARSYPTLLLQGISIVPYQIKRAQELNEQARLDERIGILEGDFRKIPFRDEAVNYAIGVESTCHCEGDDKSAVMSEMHRVLKPGGRFVIADVLRKHDRPIRGMLGKAYRGLCDCWALESFAEKGALKRKLEDLGFKDIRFEEVSWHVAPSVMHVPGVIAKWIFRELQRDRKEALKKERVEHVKASFLSIILGLARPHFGYYLISGRKN